MNDTLDEITTLATADTLRDKEDVLRLMAMGNALKAHLLRQLQVKELHTHPVYQQIQRLNFWPWSGNLETVVEEIGTANILEHWGKCVESAKADCAIVSDLMAERKKRDRALEIEDRKVRALERSNALKERTLNLLERGKKRIKKLLGQGESK